MIKKGTSCFITYGLTKDISIDFIYASQTYAGVFMSSPKKVEEMEEKFLNNAIKKFKHLTNNDDIPFQMFKEYQKEYSSVLKTRVCMTVLITKDCKELGVIWFDDGDIDIYISLENILNKIDFSLAREFDY